MYDTFEAFKKVEKQSFSFNPIRYEIWIGGKKIEAGNSNDEIYVEAKRIDDADLMIIHFLDKKLHSQLNPTSTFDEFMTSNDRLQLVNIPAKSNVESMGIEMFKNIIGSTRDNMIFNFNDPYCCNLFLVQGEIQKMTFSFPNPDKLIEFYQY